MASSRFSGVTLGLLLLAGPLQLTPDLVNSDGPDAVRGATIRAIVSAPAARNFERFAAALEAFASATRSCARGLWNLCVKAITRLSAGPSNRMRPSISGRAPELCEAGGRGPGRSAVFERYSLAQHFLYFFPLPQGQGSFRPMRLPARLTGLGLPAMASANASLRART